MNHNPIPVITIDGPSGVGKGTIAKRIAIELGWNYLDSGAIYRVIGWAANQTAVDLHDEEALLAIIAKLNIRMAFREQDTEPVVYCNDQDVSQAIRSPQCAQTASEISAIPAVRTALLQTQRKMRKSPGLVTDGRDMGTVIFPDALVKFYFIANAKERAKRRYNQLKAKEINVSLPDIEKEINRRDHRDENRAVAPSKPAEDAVEIDTTDLSIEQVFEAVMSVIHERIS